MRKLMLVTALAFGAAAGLGALASPASAHDAEHRQGVASQANGHDSGRRQRDAAGPGEARDTGRRHAAACRASAGTATQLAAAIRSNLESLGYRVQEVRQDGGCVAARAVNDSGLPISVHYDAATGDLVLARLRS